MAVTFNTGKSSILDTVKKPATVTKSPSYSASPTPAPKAATSSNKLVNSGYSYTPTISKPITTPSKAYQPAQTYYPVGHPPGDVQIKQPSIVKNPSYSYTQPRPPTVTLPPTRTSTPTRTPSGGGGSTPSYPPSSGGGYPSTPTSGGGYPTGGGGAVDPVPAQAGAMPDMSSVANAMAMMLNVNAPTATSDQSQSQNVYVSGGGGGGPMLPGQADRAFSGADPRIAARAGQGNYLDALRSGFWG
jgi:hypothetical protein